VEPGVPAVGDRGSTEGERRQVTVLFSDLVGSSALAARLDPEEWRDLAAAYQKAIAATVTELGGHVAKYLGDGVVAFFGYPRAYGDDAERATRAGLAILAAVATLNAGPAGRHGVTLAVRVGVDTGPVVVGEGGGGQVDVFGDVPNVAARVQALASPDTLLITAATQRLVAGLFVVDEGGTHALKGIPQMVTVYRVVGPSGVRGRPFVGPARAFTPFVGRDEERGLLLGRWERAREGDGQVVLVTGEAGIGKSRLVQALRERLAHERHAWVESAGSPYHQNTPFHAVVDMLRQCLSGGEATPARRLERLESALALSGMRPDEAVPLVAPLLDLPVPDSYPPLLLSPEGQRRRLLATLVAWVVAAARLQPLVIVIEDLQWVDPSTLELLGLLMPQAATVQLLLVYTARPEFRAPWPPRTNCTHLTLGRLNRRQARAMVGFVARAGALPEEVTSVVVARSDGVPLFVEELTRLIVESERADAIREIPATLNDLLMARLDRLGAAKEVAQVGAVVGREFPYALIAAASGLPEEELQGGLARLVEAELLYANGLPPEATYLFKHALIQDAAYGSLLRSRRRSLHGAIARALLEHLPERAEAHPEVLAYHHAEAGDAEPAIAAWQRAGERAVARSAHAEAADHFRKGLAALATLPDAPERTQRELLLQIALGHSLGTRSYADPEVAGVFTRARELCERLGEPGQLLVLLLGLWGSTINRGELRVARELADQLVDVAGREGSAAAGVWGHFTQGATRYYLGDVGGAYDHLGRALALYDPAQIHVAPIDPGVATLSYLGRSAWHLGLADEARRRATESIALARRLDRPYDVAWAEAFAGMAEMSRRDGPAALAHAEATIAICREQQFTQFLAIGRALRGWALATQGDSEAGLAELREGLVLYLQSGQQLALGLFLGVFAGVLGRAGAVPEGLGVIEDALAGSVGQRLFRPDLLCVRAALLARQGAEASAVEATYAEALDLARGQGALAYELRAAIGLARVRVTQGGARDVGVLLASVYDRFTEGHDTRDLVQARALLARLGTRASASVQVA
jgi:class 3 adenylate cyclase/tetratricopeptide (TPR) repeat protein